MAAPNRPILGVIWLIVAAIILIGGYKLLHPTRGADQNILIQKSK